LNTKTLNPAHNTFNIDLQIIDKKKMKALHLDIIDILLLRWLYDWSVVGALHKEVQDGLDYYWLNQKAIAKEFDIAGIRSVAGVRKRLLRMCGGLGNATPTPILAYTISKSYESQLLFHLDESILFSIISRGHLGGGLGPHPMLGE